MPLALDLTSTLDSGSIFPRATTERAISPRSAVTSFSGGIGLAFFKVADPTPIVNLAIGPRTFRPSIFGKIATATYIMTVVMVAPALVKVGVPMHVAHMLAFYFAVLSEVSPPVGLSPSAAAAITGGNPFTSMMQAWKYSLPAFLCTTYFLSRQNIIGVRVANNHAFVIFKLQVINGNPEKLHAL